MRKIPILLLLFCLQAHAAFVQQTDTSNASGQTTLTTTAITVTAGHALVAFVGGESPANAGNVSVTGDGTFSFACAVGQPAGVTLASAPSMGATSATLASSWSNPSGSYALNFSDNETRYATFTNGTTGVSWTNPLTAGVSTSVNPGTNNGNSIMAFVILNAASGSHAITATDTSANLQGLAVVEYSGVATTGTVGCINGVVVGPGLGTNAIYTDTLATGSTPAEVVGLALSNASSSTSVSAGTGFTGRTTVFSTWASYGYLEDEAPGSGTSFLTTWTANNSQFNSYQTVMATLPAAGSTCTHTGWNLATGAFSTPTAGSGTFWLKSGAASSTDCSATQYWQPSGAFGAN